jgi:hypothetical protein
MDFFTKTQGYGTQRNMIHPTSSLPLLWDSLNLLLPALPPPTRLSRHPEH